MDWINNEEKLPKQSGIVKVKLDDGKELKAYFYPDAISWITFYGLKGCYFWDKSTKEALHNVTHWMFLPKEPDETI